MDLVETVSRLSDITAIHQHKECTGTYPHGTDRERNVHMFDLRIDGRPLRFVIHATVLYDGILESKFGHQLHVDYDFADYANLKCLTDIFNVSEYFNLPDEYKVRPVSATSRAFIKLRVGKESLRYQFKNDWKADPKNTKAATLKSGDVIKLVAIPQIYISDEEDKNGTKWAGFTFHYVEINKVKGKKK